MKERLGHEHLDSLQHDAKLKIADLKKGAPATTPANVRVKLRATLPMFPPISRSEILDELPRLTH